MKYLKTFERYEAYQKATKYKKGEDILFIKDYDDILKRGKVFKITNVDDENNILSITNKDGVIANISFDGDVETYFKKSYDGNNIDSDLLL